MKNSIPFVSQMGTSHEEYGCGVAATLMLLGGTSYPVESFAATAEGLKVDDLPSRKWGPSGAGKGYGAWARDVSAYLSGRNVPHVLLADCKTPIAKRLLRELLRSVPVMVGVDNARHSWGEGGHWIVVESGKSDTFSYLDPADSVRIHGNSISWKKMARDWDGSAVAVVERDA